MGKKKKMEKEFTFDRRKRRKEKQNGSLIRGRKR